MPEQWKLGLQHQRFQSISCCCCCCCLGHWVKSIFNKLSYFIDKLCADYRDTDRRRFTHVRACVSINTNGNCSQISTPLTLSISLCHSLTIARTLKSRWSHTQLPISQHRRKSLCGKYSSLLGFIFFFLLFFLLLFCLSAVVVVVATLLGSSLVAPARLGYSHCIIKLVTHSDSTFIPDNPYFVLFCI